ncbi:hypothetical protein Tco_0489164 [Tanacetum coccineum]
MHCTNLVLTLREAKDFIAYCDASKKGLGVVLMQREKVKAEHQRPYGLVSAGRDTLHMESGSNITWILSRSFLISSQDPMDKLDKNVLKGGSHEAKDYP